MYLQKLEINGFKSFAKKTTFELTKGITAIVGPNGSGKSNVADAVRWVMGEQSIKVLRGKRAQDVIFSGSDKKGRLGLASVSLTINNEDHSMPIDYPEVIITRTIHRSGEGEYFVNNKRARLQDILLLLARSNVGQKTYSVIGQGMIDSILTSSPSERKTFFEEAAGVRPYQMKRDIALNKLAQTRENLRQVDILLSEISPRLRSLNRQMKRLEQRGEVEEKLHAIQQHFYAVQWTELTTKRTEEQKITDTIETERAAVTKEISATQSELEKHEREESRDVSFRKMQNAYNETLDRKNALLRQQAALKGALDAEEQRISGASIVWLKKRTEDLTKAIGRKRDEHDAVQSTIDRVDKDLTAKQTAQAAIVKDFEKLEAELIKTRDAIENEKAVDLPNVKANFEEIHADYRKLADSIARATEGTSIPALAKASTALGKKVDHFAQTIDRLNRQSAPRELVRLQGELTEFLKTKDSLVNEINDLTIKLTTAKEKRDLLTGTIRSLTDEAEGIQAEIDRANVMPSAADDKLKRVMDENNRLQEKVDALDAELTKQREAINTFNTDEQKKKDTFFGLQKAFRDQQQKLAGITARLNEMRVSTARIETKQEDLRHEISQELPEADVQKLIQKPEMNPELTSLSAYELSDRIQKAKHQLELIGGIDEDVEGEQKETEERFTSLNDQDEDLKKAMRSLETAIAELDETIKRQFDESFKAINEQFGKYFKILFKGGSAKLILQKQELTEAEEAEREMIEGEEDDDDDEEPTAVRQTENVISGIDISAAPPGKKISTITMLSGGERALTSIALIVAILANNPSPFVILDETDAALDEANSLKYASILEQLSKDTQFITISHNRATMSKAGTLYGVTMGADGVTKLLSVKMEEAEDVIKKHGNR